MQQAEFSREFQGVLGLSRPDGSAFPDEDLEHFIGFLLVQSIAKVRPETLPKGALVVLGKISQAAGITADDDGVASQHKIDRYYAEHPPSPLLLQAVGQLMQRANATSADVAEVARGFAALLGNDGKVTGVLGGGVRPTGTAPGGALGMLAARTGKLSK